MTTTRTVPSSPPTTVAEAEPTTWWSRPPAKRSSRRSHWRGQYFEAQNDYDAELAMSYLSEDSKFGWRWALPSPVGPERFRLEIETRQLTTSKLARRLHPGRESEAGVSIRCDHAYQDFRSDELGLGPFGGNSVDVGVVDGKIASLVATVPIEANGFAQQMWDPFPGPGSKRNHADDVPVMDAVGYLEKSDRGIDTVVGAAHRRKYAQLRRAAQQNAHRLPRGVRRVRCGGCRCVPCQRSADQSGSRGNPSTRLPAGDRPGPVPGATNRISKAAAKCCATRSRDCWVRCPFVYQLLGSGGVGPGAVRRGATSPSLSTARAA